MADDQRPGDSGSIVTSYRCPTAGAPMQTVEEICFTVGEAFEDDRYAKGIAVYSAVEPAKIRHAAFILFSSVAAS